MNNIVILTHFANVRYVPASFGHESPDYHPQRLPQVALQENLEHCVGRKVGSEDSKGKLLGLMKRKSD